MFGWWKRRRLRKGRAIYRFWDGSQYRWADPVALFMDINADDEYEASVHLKLVENNDPDAIAITTAAVRRVFKVQPYNEDNGIGLTVGEQLGLLLDFYMYLEAQQKKTQSSPTSPSNSEESTSENSNDETTTPTSDSGATSKEPTSEEPMLSG